MNKITRQDILAHQSVVPWPLQEQVEQDLLLCRAMVAIFDDDFLSTQLAMRGGTVLHKVHLAPASRYSEDIDLVVIGDASEDAIKKALQDALKDVLGPPKEAVWDSIQLAIRNTFRPSKVLRLTYRVGSISEPGRALGIVVEANVDERKPHRSPIVIPFGFPFRESEVSTGVVSYDIHEMLGTKLRALFQRSRGRDLFDLYWALTTSGTTVSPMEIIESFRHYMRQENSSAGRSEFVGILDSHLKAPGFRSDMGPLLRTGISYDPLQAGEFIKQNLLYLLPENGIDDSIRK